MLSFDSFVDRAVVINLATRSDRKQETEEELQRINFSRATFYITQKPEEPGFFRTAGERGCFESHVGLWREAIGARNLLIMEDDVQFSADFAQSVCALQSLPEDWDIIYLGYDQHPSVSRNIHGSGLVRVGPDFEFIGTHCYMLNGGSIQRFLDACVDISSLRNENGYAITIDGIINIARKRHDFVSYIIVPPLAVQRSSKTDIADPKWFDAVPLLNIVIQRARRVKNALRRL